MSTNNWVAVIGCILIILATLFGRWWLLKHQYRKQNNTKMAEIEDFDIDYNEVAYDRTPEEADFPIQDRWPVFATPELDLLTSAFDDAHPNKKHDMRFKSKNYVFDTGVVYKFECLYCRHEAKLLKKDFWGTPTQTEWAFEVSDPTTRPRLRACVEAWPDAHEGGCDPRCCRFPKSCSADVYDPAHVSKEDLESHDVGVDYGVLYTPLDGVMRVGEFKQPQSDRPDAMTMQLMAYAEHIKKPQNPSEDPRYSEVLQLVSEGYFDEAQQLENEIWADIRDEAREVRDEL